MSSLVKMRAERDQMSAIERRIADFIVENAHLMRDYSSQQLADALEISQSSVVKFSQKLGFKGYPDLKYSVGEATARNNGMEEANPTEAADGSPHAVLSESLWRAKSASEEETRLINTSAQLDSIATAIDKAGKVFVAGLGQDGADAEAFALKLSLLGVTSAQHTDPVAMMASISTALPTDVLLVLCEHGKQSALAQIARQFRATGGLVISVTRHTPNPLRAHAGASLLVSAHHEKPFIEPLLYRAALQHLLDILFVLLCERNENRRDRLADNLHRLQHLVEP